ncbi:MAG: hypothetical protein ACRD1T_00450 [Acidimicrobiia bacterium]
MPAGDVYFPSGLKVTLIYNRLQVSSGGLFGGGYYLFVPRTPSAEIVGPSYAVVSPGESSVVKRFWVRTDDLRGSTSIIWIADGVVSTPTEETTLVTLDTSGAASGTMLLKDISVRVADVDGLTAEARHTVAIYVGDVADESIPAAARAEPWLPEHSGYFREVGASDARDVSATRTS